MSWTSDTLDSPQETVPWPVAFGFTVWMLFWVPVILWAYGPQNFLWLCNVAQFVLLYGLWRSNWLLISSQAGTLVLVGVFWAPDFLLGLATGGATATFTAYMFNPDNALLARATSLYHIVLPVVLLWLLARHGYDRRAPWLQTGIGAPVLIGSWLFTDPERNINWIREPFGVEQVWFPEPVYVTLLLLAYPLLLYFPGHLLVDRLRRWLARRLY